MRSRLSTLLHSLTACIIKMQIAINFLCSFAINFAIAEIAGGQLGPVRASPETQ